MRDIEQGVERYYQAPPPRPNEAAFEAAGLNRGCREGGCIISLTGRKSIRVVESREEVLKMQKEGKMFDVEYNGYDVYSGKAITINPEYIVSVE